MTPTADIHALTGAYALNALDSHERAEFEAHLGQCEACLLEVAEFEATAGKLGTAVEVTPPPALKASILGAIGQIPQESSLSRAGSNMADVIALSEPRRSDRVVRVLAQAAAAVAVVAVGAAAITQMNNGDQDRIVALEEQIAALGGGAVTDVLASPDLQTWQVNGPGGSSARLIYSQTHGQGWLLGSGMGAAPAGHTYELWLIGDDGPVAAGIFDAHDDGHVAASFTAASLNAAAVGVTVEPDGGSPQPTTEPVMLIEL